MTERIDHAAEALKIMHDVSTDNRGAIPLELFDSYERWAYEVTMQEAQVHATLALVEQQRISNDLSTQVKESNDRLLEQMNDVVKIAREGWDNHNRLVAAVEQERANR